MFDRPPARRTDGAAFCFMNERVIQQTADFWASFAAEVKRAIEPHVARIGGAAVGDWLAQPHETELFSRLTRDARERLRPMLDRTAFWRCVDRLIARGHQPTDKQIARRHAPQSVSER